ncbi:MAG TPA: 30S ribosomal protein S12 methylthiotransferase RimO [Candidatus Kapabacteria bacterium]|nr:30S ribosomal protein S12 methylthiotransferase RimO [Candidatus Kapabacteria bacterium]
MKNKQKISVLTLGCPKNIVDSEKFITMLDKSRYEVSLTFDHPDILVINTCGFIQSARDENQSVIEEAIDLKSKGAIKQLYVVGCYSQRYDEFLSARYPQVDKFFGIDFQMDLLRELNSDKYELQGERFLLTPKHYAYLKISDGCDRTCSFCAIPQIKGMHHSLSIEELTTEAHALALQGVKELILIGQDTTSYGIDIYKKQMLPKLLDELSNIEQFKWIRLMYVYPKALQDEVLDLIAERPNIAKYIDVPIQHISDSVLSAMKRATSKKNIIDLIEKIRNKIPNITIRTTLLTGFPNETEKDFIELLDFVKEYQFDRLGVFTYSREEGTTAYELGDPIPEKEKQRRQEALMLAQQEISLKKNQFKIGQTLEVIVDEIDKGKIIARTESDAPDIDNNVIIKSNQKIHIGDIIKASIASATEYDLYGKIIK